MSDARRTVCLDFDGVIHLNNGTHGATIISGEPVAGVVHAIEQMREQYKVVIFSARCSEPGGVEAIKDWLSVQGIEVDGVVDYKPLALVYVDDRGLSFDGDWSATMDQIEGFEPWYVHHNREKARKRQRFQLPVRGRRRAPPPR